VFLSSSFFRATPWGFAVVKTPEVEVLTQALRQLSTAVNDSKIMKQKLSFIGLSKKNLTNESFG